MVERGLTQQQVAGAAGVSRTAVIKWLRGSVPRALELFKFASSQGLAVEWFFMESPLTTEVYSLTFDGVKPVLPKLMQRLKRATEAYGRKAELAAYLGVHRQMVTDWLSGKQEPGGETTLRLLYWVEQEERKK